MVVWLFVCCVWSLPGEDSTVGLLLGQSIPAEDDGHQEYEDDQGDEVAKHDPGGEGEGVHDQVVEEDSKEGSEDVDEADVKDNGGAREGGMEEVHGKDEAVEGEEESGAAEQEGGKDQVVTVVRRVDMVNLAANVETNTYSFFGRAGS